MRRHRVPIPDSDKKFYTVEYFNVGKEIKMYGRVYKLTDCDQFTQGKDSKDLKKFMKSDNFIIFFRIPYQM